MANSTLVSSTLSNASSDDAKQADELLERIDSLLEIVADGHRDQTCGGDEAIVDAMATSLEEMRVALHQRDTALASMAERFDAQARAQADAIVHSAEIIDELERMKQHLSDATGAAKTAAQDTQRLADTIFEQTHDGVLVFNDRACVACNENATELLGSVRTELLGCWPGIFESARYEDASDAGEDLRYAYEHVDDDSRKSIEVLLERQGESTFWAEITLSAFNMQDAGHVLIVVCDITPRKQFEAELRGHRDFLNNVINAVPDQISVKGMDGTLLVVNDAFCAAHGLHRRDAVGMSADKLLTGEDAKRLAEAERQFLLTGKCENTQHEFSSPDGCRSVVSVKRSAFKGGSTGEKYIVAASRDITDDRVREDRLRLLASVFNGASEGVAILAPTGEICEANPAFLRMVSSEDQSPVGQVINQALSFEIGEMGEPLVEVANGNSWSGKATSRNSNTDSRSYWVSLSPSSEADNQSKRIVALVSDITELESTQAKLRRQALYDNLTGLPNRAYFREHLQAKISEAITSQSSVTVCFLDLDDFKHVNDSGGHSIGDHLLQEVGTRIQQIVGKGAFVARFGGDEFAIILEHEQHENNTLDDLLVAFRKPFHLGDMEAVVGLSIGVTRFPEHGSDVDTLMCNADIAMYESKSAGKNRVRVFDPALLQGINMRTQVQTKLRRALVEGEISLCFQPKMCAKTRSPAGCEALVRWQTRDGEFIPPNEFIPVAEQTGLILALGELVFQLAAEQACRWSVEGLSPAIAVNVSPHQLRHPRFVEQLTAVLEETGAQASWFELEITEHAMMDDVEHAISVIDELAQLGFRVAIDDFGTGYSSLSYLKSFKIHTLKIDLSFVRDVTHDTQSEAIVRSIVSLGTGLGLTVVAEGVETAEHADVLTEAGCTVLQGYYFGKPMPEAKYVEWLQSQQSTLSVT